MSAVLVSLAVIGLLLAANAIFVAAEFAIVGASRAQIELDAAEGSRLAQRVAASERRHSGEICICVEASLPMSYLWRLNAQNSIAVLTRQRAVTMFPAAHCDIHTNMQRPVPVGAWADAHWAARTERAWRWGC